MRSTFLALLLVALSASSAGAAAWRGVTDRWIWGRIDGLHFADSLRGWVATGSGTIQHTTDAGKTWVPQYSNPNLYFRSLMFSDSLHGWAGTLTTSSLMLTTSNGGANWTVVSNIPDPKPPGVCGLWVASPQVIYGVGSYSGPARLIKSADGGATWTAKDMSPLASTLIDVHFFNELEGIIVGGRGVFPNDIVSVVLQTSDGGATWQERYLGTRNSEWGWKISFPTRDTGYVSLERWSGPMFVLKTVNGGVSWSELSFADYNEQGIGFVTTRMGWVGGSDNPTFLTTDGGQTWTTAWWGEHVDRFQFLSPHCGYASGAAVYKYSDDVVGVEPPIANAPKSLSAAPNPFKPQTTIRYRLAQSATVELFVADPAGRVVRWLVRGSQNAGSNQIAWDGRSDDGRELPAGIYLYVLHAGDQHEMGKLVRVR